MENSKRNALSVARIESLLLNNKALLITIVLGAILSFSTPVFLTQTNILNVLRQVCVSTIVAVGFSLLLGSGNIDLSVGSILGLVGIIMGELMLLKVPTPLLIIIGILSGIACGLINSAMIITFTLPPFIVTLATSQIFRGIGYVITNMGPILGFPDDFLFWGQGYIGPIPTPIYIMAFITLLLYFIVNYTAFGRYAIAMGGNMEATRVSGVNVNAVRYGVYAVLGGCAGVAGLITTARVGSSQVAAGVGMEMDAIAAVVIGGTSMSGGNCKIFGSLLGCVIVGMVNNALNLLSIGSTWQVIVKGIMILFAVLLDSVTTKLYAQREKRV